MTNERSFVKCIKHLVKIARGSMSYASWQKITKYPVKECPICKESFEYVKPESHHHPLTIFDIFETCVQKHIDLDDLYEYTDLQIVEEVMEKHFAREVDYIVLCKHCHQKYHDHVPDVLDAITVAHEKQKKLIKEFYATRSD